MDLSAAFKTVSVGEPVTFQNLTVFPLLAQRGAEAAYLTLDAALATGGLSVTGVSHGGSVPDLLVTNRLDRPVLLLDGEEVIGAKQNRVFNLSILVAARSKTVVPVSCVEAGRWSQVSPLLAASQRTQHSTGRAERLLQVSESLAALQSPRSDQGRVWQEIARKSAQMAVDSPTGAMADIYERFSAPVDRFVAAIAPVESQCGAVFAMNSTISNFFGAPESGQVAARLFHFDAVGVIGKLESHELVAHIHAARRGDIDALLVERAQLFGIGGYLLEMMIRRACQPQCVGQGIIVQIPPGFVQPTCFPCGIEQILVKGQPVKGQAHDASYFFLLGLSVLAIQA